MFVEDAPTAPLRSPSILSKHMSKLLLHTSVLPFQNGVGGNFPNLLTIQAN
jgi:hypothetical protein